VGKTNQEKKELNQKRGAVLGKVLSVQRKMESFHTLYKRELLEGSNYVNKKKKI